MVVIIKNIKLMPFAIKVILFFELFAPLFSLLKVLGVLPSSEVAMPHQNLVLLVSVLPCLIAAFMILNRKQRAIAAVVVSWFTVNLSSLVVADGSAVEGSLHLIIGFVSVMGLALFAYLKLSPSIKTYFEE